MKKKSAGCDIDMTPMIDVVFQLIIFFIVTIKMDEAKADIELEMGPHGPPIKETVHTTIIVEVNRFGVLSMHGAVMNQGMFKRFMRARYKKFGEFPVIIRADRRTKHKDVRKLMDACTEAGIWRINFMAIKEDKTPDTR